MSLKKQLKPHVKVLSKNLFKNTSNILKQYDTLKLLQHYLRTEFFNQLLPTLTIEIANEYVCNEMNLQKINPWSILQDIESEETYVDHKNKLTIKLKYKNSWNVCQKKLEKVSVFFCFSNEIRNSNFFISQDLENSIHFIRTKECSISDSFFNVHIHFTDKKSWNPIILFAKHSVEDAQKKIREEILIGLGKAGLDLKKINIKFNDEEYTFIEDDEIKACLDLVKQLNCAQTIKTSPR